MTETGLWDARPLRPAGYLDDSTKDDASGKWCVVRRTAIGIERFIGHKDACAAVRDVLNEHCGE